MHPARPAIQPGPRTPGPWGNQTAWGKPHAVRLFLPPLDHCPPATPAVLLVPDVPRPGSQLAHAPASRPDRTSPRGARGFAPTLAGLLTLAGTLLTSCDRPPHGPVTLLSDPVSVTATVLDGEDPPTYRVEVRQDDRLFEVRTRCGAPPAGAETALRRLVAWRAPYLFVREDNGGGNAWRADVDHVFKVGTNRLQRLGTVSARFGEPGSQWQGDRFLDLYDRLEFTPLTSHAQAPGFTLVMRERDGAFEVHLDETWDRARPEFTRWLAELRSFADRPAPPATEGARRDVRGTALRCLTLARYCRRTAEYDESLALARKALGAIDDLEEALAQVTPGELAPSLEAVFRLHPGLINVFRDTPVPESESAVAKPPPISFGTPP